LSLAFSTPVLPKDSEYQTSLSNLNTMPDVCRQSAMPVFQPNGTIAHGATYCAISYPDVLPNITSLCCKQESTLQIYNNCTQYCEVPENTTNIVWSNCIRENIPAFQEMSIYMCDKNSGAGNLQKGLMAVVSAGLIVKLLLL